MADVANLNIIIGANVSQAEQGLNSVSQKLGQTAVAATKVDSSLAKSVGSTNSAAIALSNLGRVAQDAPFGFIAIQNNLNPLLESFQRLKAESGSTGAALKALAGSMLGPAGLGIALSLVSAAILLFTSRNRGAKDSVEDTGKAVKTLSQVLEDSTVSVQGQIAKVQALVAAYGDRTKSVNEQKAALQELTKIDKEHFGALTVEKSSYEDVKVAADAYTQSLINQAIVKGVTDDITELSKQLRAAQKEYVNAAIAAEKANRDIKNTSEALAGFTPGGVVVQTRALTRFSEEEEKARQNLLKFRKDMQGLTDELQKQIGLNLIDDVLFPDIEKTKKKKDEVVSILQDLNTNIKDISGKFIASIAVETGNAFDILGKSLDGLPLKVKGIDDVLAKSADREGLKKLAIQMDAINTITETVKETFDSLFTSIANGENVFHALGSAVKQFISKLVAAVVEAAILSLIINALFPGAGNFSFGALFSQLSGLPKFGTGGVVTRPTVALVGESGPERITPLGELAGSAGNLIQGNVVFKIHGRELRGVLQMANASANTFE